MKIRILGLCDKCGGILIKNLHGKVFCPECQVEEAIEKFKKSDKEAKNGLLKEFTD